MLLSVATQLARVAALFTIDDSYPIIINSILYNNSGGEIVDIEGSTPDVTYSIVEGGYTGLGNKDEDPQLGPLQDNGGFTMTMALGAGSPAINAGNDPSCPSTDQRGVARPQGSHCDIGAFEQDLPTVVNVTSTDANGIYSAGSVITITIEFSETVTVTGTPQLTLETGTTDRIASYSSGSGTSTLVFTYTVQAGDTSSDLDYVSTSALALNGGTIKDAENNNASLTLPSPGAAGSLGANKAIIIDTTAPGLISFTRQNPATSPTNADTLVFRATFSEAVTNVDTGDFDTYGTTTATVTNVSPVNTSTYDITVSGGDLAGFNGVVGLDLNGSQDITDLGGNDLPATEPTVDETYTLDNIPPSVDTILRVGPESTSASSVDFTVTFTESVTGVDETDFSLDATVIGASITSVLPATGPAAIYTVTVDTGSGDGTIRLDVKSSGTGIEDLAGNPLAGGFTGGEVYTIIEPASINVNIADELEGSYLIPPGESQQASYAVNNGPVQITSTNGFPLIAAMRVIWQEPGKRTSYSELMGLPAEQLSTEYWFPWYNNLATAAMNQQFRFGNADSTSTTIEVYVGDTLLESYPNIAPGVSLQASYDINNGPIRIVSTDGKKIIAAMRVIWKETGERTSYSELMGLPKEQLSTEYWFPWYNNLAKTAMNQQFRFGNADSTSTTIEVYVGDTLLESYPNIAPGVSLQASYDINNGPIRIVSTDGKKIIAAMRVIWQEPGERTSYSELMGLPKEQLSTEYWFPWYNNLATAAMNQQFRFGNADSTSTTIEVYVGDTLLESYPNIAPGVSLQASYDINNGPIRIVSTDGKKIIAAMRVIWKETGERTSYSELMGLPAEQLSTEYWFPWYNNLATTAMNQQFRFGVP
jgi:hypothetical protein